MLIPPKVKISELSDIQWKLLLDIIRDIGSQSGLFISAGIERTEEYILKQIDTGEIRLINCGDHIGMLVYNYESMEYMTLI